MVRRGLVLSTRSTIQNVGKVKFINIYPTKSEYSLAQIREEQIRFPKPNNLAGWDFVDAVLSCDQELYRTLMDMFPDKLNRAATREISDEEFALVILMFKKVIQD